MAGMKKETTGVDPFGGDSQRFTWARQVEVGQLQQELDEALGSHVRVAIVPSVQTDGTEQQVSDSAPLTVFVTPSSVDVSAVRATMAAHRPDPHFGVSDEERRRGQMKEKIISGQELSLAEVTEALRMLVS